MNVLRSFRGWVALVTTILLWGLALYGFWSVDQQKANYAALVEKVEQDAQIAAQSSRLHGLLSETKGQRATLQGIVSADVVGLVESVDTVGKAVGISLQISNVQPEGAKKGAPTGTPIPVNLVVQSEGSFAQTARLVELLSSLSIPSTIQQLEFSRSGSGWHLTARIRVLTASEVSS